MHAPLAVGLSRSGSELIHQSLRVGARLHLAGRGPRHVSAVPNAPHVRAATERAAPRAEHRHLVRGRQCVLRRLCRNLAESEAGRATIDDVARRAVRAHQVGVREHRDVTAAGRRCGGRSLRRRNGEFRSSASRARCGRAMAWLRCRGAALRAGLLVERDEVIAGRAERHVCGIGAAGDALSPLARARALAAPTTSVRRCRSWRLVPALGPAHASIVQGRKVWTPLDPVGDAAQNRRQARIRRPFAYIGATGLNLRPPGPKPRGRRSVQGVERRSRAMRDPIAQEMDLDCSPPDPTEFGGPTRIPGRALHSSAQGLDPVGTSAGAPSERRKSHICGPFVSIGETGFEPATARPPAGEFRCF